MLGTCRRGELSMRVLVTGGTGYVGCHTVAALAGQGHQVRLLVRARDRIAPALDPLGVAGADAVAGDVTSAAAVEEAMLGCDAVVHAAAVFSLDPRQAAVMQQANPAPRRSWRPRSAAGWTRSSTSRPWGCSCRSPARC
jgi:uncharacterized protein YbjT (DUF2867 family)